MTGIPQELSYDVFTDDSSLSPYHVASKELGYAYLVAWRDGDRHVVKVGETSRPARWRRWVSSGAEVRIIFRSSWRVAMALESRVHSLFTECGVPLAFSSQQEAARLLGSGGGWMETFQIHPFIAEAVMKGEIRALVQG